jgi:hypothetical protein
MRLSAWTIVGVATTLVSNGLQAQTYDPNYPICIQGYDIDGSPIDCSYTSLTQCKASASGLAAECFTNPYFTVRGRTHGRPAASSIRPKNSLPLGQ